MGKYKESFYLQVWRKGILKLNQHNKKIPYSTRWLYIHLHELEHRFSGRNEDFFFRSIKDLQKDTQISYERIIEGIKILEKANLIQTWQMHWYVDKERKKKSARHITAFRILEP